MKKQGYLQSHLKSSISPINSSREIDPYGMPPVGVTKTKKPFLPNLRKFRMINERIRFQPDVQMPDQNVAKQTALPQSYRQLNKSRVKHVQGIYNCKLFIKSNTYSYSKPFCQQKE